MSFFPRSYLLNFTDSLETPLPSVHAYWLYNEGMLIVADLSPNELRAHLFRMILQAYTSCAERRDVELES